MSETSVALTPRETEIVKLLIHELSYAEIGRRLGISRRTVKVHVHHIAAKLPDDRFGAKRRVERWATSSGVSPWGQ